MGYAGKFAATFVQSKLTPLIVIAALLLGFVAVLRTPREEEPQIIVPMADVIVSMPGASAKDVEQRVSTPLEKLIWEIPGIEYVYSISSPGQSMVIVRFLVGQDQERAFVRLREKIQSHYDQIPPGASQPIVKPRSIDDVPILALTLHSKTVPEATLRQIADRVDESIKSVNEVSETSIIGGSPRELLIQPDRAKLAAFGLSLDAISSALNASNQSVQAGSFGGESGNVAIRSGKFFTTKSEVAELTVGTSGGRPVRLADVAEVRDQAGEPTTIVQFGQGADLSLEPAVTISVAKRQGANAIDVVRAVLQKVERLNGALIPSDVQVTVTRNYGESAAEKSGDLLFHMGIAVVSVTLLIAFALGRKEALVVLVAIPVTLALTLLVFMLYGFTLNRITLFALIFSIGILVDDAIVVVENIVRHIRLPENARRNVTKVAVEAVDEVGNPTILATFAVIAAILPMAFVGGLMGPYMRPIPIGASSAMLFSLAIAFIVTPWAAVRLLGKSNQSVRHSEQENRLTFLYRRIMTPLLERPRIRWAFLFGIVVLLLGSMSLIATKAVTVKMLPFDNKNEFQVIVDMPTGTSLERTYAVTSELARVAAKLPEAENIQIYAGTTAPYNFNGLVRHYFTRSQPDQADIQINLKSKSERRAQSHEIAKRLREQIAPLANALGARIKVAEVPPGPPVLQTLVAEIYGPDEKTQLEVARDVKAIFKQTSGVADVDWYMDDDQPTLRLAVDQQKAALSGVNVDTANKAIQAALSGRQIGLLHDEGSREDVPIVLRLSRSQRSGVEALQNLTVSGAGGQPVPLAELVRATAEPTDKTRYHKNLRPVIYVTGDVTGRQESPVYAILQMNKSVENLRLADGSKVEIMSTHLPDDPNQTAIKWDGEWHITYEVFRDLGLAFAAVLVLIYVLVVGWFQDFKTPIIIMAPIPLTLVGILPAHALMGAFFTATSMIGFIAGAGIIVRNSIILVDFIELRRRQGVPLEQAVIDAGATRFRPMLLTAMAVIVGSFVILFDPIFQGLAIALMAGEVASTLLSRLAVPVLYFMAERGKSYPLADQTPPVEQEHDLTLQGVSI